MVFFNSSFLPSRLNVTDKAVVIPAKKMNIGNMNIGSGMKIRLLKVAQTIELVIDITTKLTKRDFTILRFRFSF